MKTSHVESMDELVFKNKNRLYGAYILRRNYNKALCVALLTGLFIFLSAFSYPLLAAYLHPSHATLAHAGDVTYDPMSYTPDYTPPPPPAAEPVLPDRIRLLAPKVVDRDIESGLASQDELGAQSATPPPSGDPDATPAETPPNQVFDIPAPPPDPIAVPEEMPLFPGGDGELFRFLKENIHYPDEARQLGVSGRVYIFFIVETDGSISNVTLKRGIGSGCDEEALRVVSLMPRWSPGKQGGVPVRVQYTLPVKFILQ